MFRLVVPDLCHVPLTLLLCHLTLSLDKFAQIPNWQREGEVNRLKDHGEPEIPSNHRSDERESSAHDSCCVAQIHQAIRTVEVGCCEAWERYDEAEEHCNKADVGTKGGDKLFRPSVSGY